MSGQFLEVEPTRDIVARRVCLTLGIGILVLYAGSWFL